MTGREGQREGWERNERYRELVELAPDGILIHDGDSIVFANASAVRLAGATSREQIVGQPIDAFLDPPYLKAVETALTQPNHPTQLTPPVRDTLRRLDGTEVQVEVRAIVFMDGDRVSGHLVLRDITERLAAEHAEQLVELRLQQAQRMESVGALAGGVAHEVNNMMAVVLGFADLVTRNPRLPADCLADMREITKAADRAAAVTRQLLAFSRRAIRRPRSLDLGQAVRGLEIVLRRLLGESRHLVVRADAGPHVWMDPGQFEQVLINLALNARDATSDGGTLTISTGDVELPAGLAAGGGGTIPEGHYAIVTVADSGTGMDTATLARIFEPFFTTKPVGHGTGLGLAAVHGILTQSGGFIGVVSVPGVGTTFALYLPASPPPSLADRRAEAHGAPVETTAASARLLVVDDEPAVRAVAARILEYAGYQVLQAADGAAALELVDEHGPPHLVITDLMMPGIGGAALAQRLRERSPDLPILFMSGYSGEELNRLGALEDECKLIQKPFTPRGLLACVATALARTPAAGAPPG